VELVDSAGMTPLAAALEPAGGAPSAEALIGALTGTPADELSLLETGDIGAALS